jgi:hypothetical protein
VFSSSEVRSVLPSSPSFRWDSSALLPFCLSFGQDEINRYMSWRK